MHGSDITLNLYIPSFQFCLPVLSPAPQLLKQLFWLESSATSPHCGVHFSHIFLADLHNISVVWRLQEFEGHSLLGCSSLTEIQ